MEISIWLSFDDPFGVKENSFLIIGPFAFISPFCTLVRGGILFYHHSCDGEDKLCSDLWRSDASKGFSRKAIQSDALLLSNSQQDEGKKKVIWALKAFVAHLSGLYQALREESHLTSRYLMIVNVCDDRVVGGVMFTFFSLSIVNEGGKTWPKKGERWSDGDVKVRNLMILLEIGWALNCLMVCD